jgi:transposase
VKANKKSYFREFKIEAVRLSHSSDKNVDAIAESLGISKSTLHRWRNEFRDDPDQAFPGKGTIGQNVARPNETDSVDFTIASGYWVFGQNTNVYLPMVIKN